MHSRKPISGSSSVLSLPTHSIMSPLGRWELRRMCPPHFFQPPRIFSSLSNSPSDCHLEVQAEHAARRTVRGVVRPLDGPANGRANGLPWKSKGNEEKFPDHVQSSCSVGSVGCSTREFQRTSGGETQGAKVAVDSCLYNDPSTSGGSIRSWDTFTNSWASFASVFVFISWLSCLPGPRPSQFMHLVLLSYKKWIIFLCWPTEMSIVEVHECLTSCLTYSSFESFLFKNYKPFYIKTCCIHKAK